MKPLPPGDYSLPALPPCLPPGHTLRKTNLGSHPHLPAEVQTPYGSLQQLDVCGILITDSYRLALYRMRRTSSSASRTPALARQRVYLRYFVNPSIPFDSVDPGDLGVRELHSGARMLRQHQKRSLFGRNYSGDARTGLSWLTFARCAGHLAPTRNLDKRNNAKNSTNCQKNRRVQ
jgi:hypothetical protein